MANAPKNSQPKIEVVICKQGRVLIMEFFSRLMTIPSELDNVKFPQCTCLKCECKINNKLIKMMDKEKTHLFLMGLSDDLYANIRR